MMYYTRKQICELLETDDGFLLSLEQEEILLRDAPADASGAYSERMLERARVARNLVQELDVNLPGAAVIVRMREEISLLRHRLAELLERER